VSPALSVVVATRNRGAAVARAAASVLANLQPELELLVVDQSDDGSTEAALEPLRSDPRLRYLRSRTAGLTRARNEGIAAATAPLVAITDDDCEVTADWAASAVEALQSDARIAIVFGNVVPAPFDAAAGFIPGYVRQDAILARSLDAKASVDGIGACMALRREAWQELGGFDEMLGPGSVFPGGDEGDFAIRALAAGWRVLETPRLVVLHHGLRSLPEGRRLVLEYARGTGAMMAKHVRCRTPRTMRLLGVMAWRWTSGSMHQSARVGAGRHRYARLSAFLGGFAAGAAVPVDARTRLFAER
jgi:GT2 family glycosyltransferase